MTGTHVIVTVNRQTEKSVYDNYTRLHNKCSSLSDRLRTTVFSSGKFNCSGISNLGDTSKLPFWSDFGVISSSVSFRVVFEVSA